MGFVTEEKWNALRDRMTELQIKEEDIQESFVLGAGSGGQKQNKTANCVQLRYAALDIVLKSNRTRSRQVNRYDARKKLCDMVDKIQNPGTNKQDMAILKIQKQKKRRKRRNKQKDQENSI